MGGIKRHVTYANVVATLALMLATGGGALAATGGFASGGVLRGCAGKGGVLRLLKGKRCPRGQQLVAWNQRGPAGNQGPEGPKGAPGATGAEGPKGANGEPANVSWAEVNIEGHLLAGHGALESKEVATHYFVAFDRDMTDCAVVATPNGPTNLESTILSTHTQGTEVDVYISDSKTETESAAGFSIVAYC
jgi:hypothetical protein